MGPGFWWGQSFSLFWIFPLLCFVFMIAMMVMIFRRAGGCMPNCRQPAGASPDTREPPRQILDRRYAKGEIDKEQYEQLRRAVESDRCPS